MAKKKRRRKALPPTSDTPRSRQPKERPLYEGDSVMGLDVPNHNFCFDVEAEDSPLREMLGKRMNKYRWPLTSAVRNSEDEEDLGGRTVGVFVDTRYGDTHWGDWCDHPPTWMDPHLFIELAMEDERVMRVLRVAFKKNDPNAWKRLQHLFDEIFDEKYLPLIMERFAEAIPMMTQWLVMHYAQGQLDEKQKEQARKKRRR